MDHKLNLSLQFDTFAKEKRGSKCHLGVNSKDHHRCVPWVPSNLAVTLQGNCRPTEEGPEKRNRNEKRFIKHEKGLKELGLFSPEKIRWREDGGSMISTFKQGRG